MNESTASTLVEASNLYQNSLVEVMMPDMLSTFQTMRAQSPSAKVFQRSLASMVTWNKDVIDRHTNQILLVSPLLEDLIAAVFLAYVQVLSFVRLPGSKSDIRVHVPAKTTFVHMAYKLAANKFYDLTRDGKNCFQSSCTPKEIIAEAIHKTINKLLPLKQLLDAYIANEVDAEGMVSPEPFAGTASKYVAPTTLPPPTLPPPSPSVEVPPAPLSHEPPPEDDRIPPDAPPPRPEEEDHNWLDDGQSEQDLPTKRVDLSPQRVMCDEAGEDAELAH